MGTSGYRPSDSDAAWDGFDDLMDASRQVLLRGFALTRAEPKPLRNAAPLYSSGKRWAAIGVFELFMQHGGSLSSTAFAGLVKWLDLILEDDKWLASWEDPKLIERSVCAYRVLFQSFVDDAARRRARLRQGNRTRPRPRRVLFLFFGWAEWPMAGKRQYADPALRAFDKEMKKIQAADKRQRQRRRGKPS